MRLQVVRCKSQLDLESLVPEDSLLLAKDWIRELGLKGGVSSAITAQQLDGEAVVAVGRPLVHLSPDRGFQLVLHLDGSICPRCIWQQYLAIRVGLALA